MSHDTASATKDEAATEIVLPVREANAAKSPESATGEVLKRPKDEAQVSGSVELPTPVPSTAPAAPAAKKPASPKKLKTPLRSPAQVEYDEAMEAAKKANEAVEIARQKLAAANRVVQFQAGQKMIHVLLLRAEKESRESTLSAFLDAAAGDEKQVIIDYLGALNVAAELENKATGKG